MSITRLTLIGLVITVVCLLTIAAELENGDVNAMSMYWLVFLAPSVTPVIVNGFWLKFLTKQRRSLVKVIGSILPIVVLVLLTVMDHNMRFPAMVSGISTAIVNVIWLLSWPSTSPTTSNEPPEG